MINKYIVTKYFNEFVEGNTGMDNSQVVKSKNIMWILGFGILVFFTISILKNTSYLNINSEILNSFATVFISMILEAIPFIIIGALWYKL